MKHYKGDFMKKKIRSQEALIKKIEAKTFILLIVMLSITITLINLLNLN